MSVKKDFLPSSSPISFICAIEIDELLQVFIPRMYYNYRIENRASRNQPPYCLLQLQEKRTIRLPRLGRLGTPLTLPQSLYGRTLTSEPKFFGLTGLYQFCLPMVLHELRYKTKTILPTFHYIKLQ